LSHSPLRSQRQQHEQVGVGRRVGKKKGVIHTWVVRMLSSVATPKLMPIVAHRNNRRTLIFIKTISNTDTGKDIFEFSHQEHVKSFNN